MTESIQLLKQYQELSLLGSQIEPIKKPDAQDSVLYIIAKMISSHEKSEKKTQLSPEELEVRYIIEAIAQAVQQEEQQVVGTGSTDGAFQGLKDFLDDLASSAGGINNTDLKNYILETAQNIDNFKDDPNVKKEIAEAEKKKAEYDSDYAQLQKYKALYEKYFWVPGYGTYLEGMCAYYAGKLLSEGGSLNKGKVDAKFDQAINALQNELNFNRANFLVQMGDGAGIQVMIEGKDIQLENTAIQDIINVDKAELNIAKAFGQLATSSINN